MENLTTPLPMPLPRASDYTTLLEFNAGFMTKSDNLVSPDPRKGTAEFGYSNDQLLHFRWKARPTNEVVHDLVILPGECELVRVNCTPSRVFVLKWRQVPQRFFIWLQDIDTSRDNVLLTSANQILNNGAVGDAGNDGDENTQQAIPQNTPPPPQSTSQQDPNSALAQLAIAQLRQAAISPTIPEILTPQTLTTFLTTPGVSDALVPLFSDLPEDDRSVSRLEDVVRSPTFKSQADALSAAIKGGMAMEIIKGFGLEVGEQDGVLDMNGFWKALERYGDKVRKEKGEDGSGNASASGNASGGASGEK